MIRYSLKQMLRSRLKTCLFFLLLAGSACLLALGINLWDMNRRAIEGFALGVNTEAFFILPSVTTVIIHS